MGVSKNRGTSKWMVYNGKPIKMDDLGVPLFSETSICVLLGSEVDEFCFLNVDCLHQFKRHGELDYVKISAGWEHVLSH